jgi:hypothetical protein
MLKVLALRRRSSSAFFSFHQQDLRYGQGNNQALGLLWCYLTFLVESGKRLLCISSPCQGYYRERKLRRKRTNIPAQGSPFLLVHSRKMPVIQYFSREKRQKAGLVPAKYRGNVIATRRLSSLGRVATSTG